MKSNKEVGTNKINKVNNKSGIKKSKNNKKLIIIALVALVVIVAGVFLFNIFGQNGDEKDSSISDTVLVEDIPEGLPANEHVGNAVLEHIINAQETVVKGYEERPVSVELTEENKNNFVDIASCKINPETSEIELEMTSNGIPKSDDKFYYLFQIKPYDDSRELDENYITRVYKNDTAAMSLSLNANTENSRLYQKFGVAVKNNGKFELISSPKFITNPEAIAKHTGTFMEVNSKKGILIDYNRVFTGQLEDLGVKQAAINIPLSSIVGPTTNPLFPSIHYTYNGKNYTFNGVILAGFDSTVSALTNKGIQTTAIVLNDYSNAYISLIHPDARSKGVCPYYMFNGSTDDGVEILAAVGSFLADRYSGSKHGRVSNWVIANEINARKEWNYLKYTDVDTYSKEFAKGFRVLYTAIKSTASTARVFISLDQTWNKNLDNSPDYDGKDVLDCFNNYITSQGNIDWSLAYHPYNIPLTSCKSWEPSANVTHEETTKNISMQNIDVLVNYMNKPELRSPDGSCRSIMITELGYTSTQGEQLQAAALAYAFYKINNYEDIDGLLLNRQTDDATEIAQGLATGITTAGGNRKLSYNVYKYMDTDEWEKHLEFAKSIIGISDWKQIMY
ncbi:MAG: DUF5722 domain-containing protein [Lachnospiraceae bacterium]|nr:DUF5722 domain-containing protein [Lachnospiraceae bacterium]